MNANGRDGIGRVWHGSRVAVVLAAAVLACSCGDDVSAPTRVDAWDWEALATSFVNDQAARRQLLEDSLIVSTNGYARLRLQRYAIDAPGAWDALPVHNPGTRPWRTDGSHEDLPFVPIFDGQAPAPDDITAWRELGDRAFFGYPAQLLDRDPRMLEDPETRALWGMQTDERGQLQGLIEVELPDGARAVAFTCATCHGAVVDGVARPGLHNMGIDLTAMGGGPPGVQAGRVDVTPDGMNNPVAIPDLRPIQFQQVLHATGGVQNSPGALAVRIDTLITTSLGQRRRPPREVSFALAHRLWSFGDSLAPAPTDDPVLAPGAMVFARECARCHVGQPRVPLAEVGTDTLVGRSSDRGTGWYRAPSLRGVAQRQRLLHTAEFDGLDEMFDPARAGASAHPFGLTLSADDLAALRAWLAVY